ncbi:MAG TPA: hypothetical protein VGR45_17330 [Stellaceae bacterium]|nr:hypothetical protein [Stellaceae bacterium]
MSSAMAEPRVHDLLLDPAVWTQREAGIDHVIHLGRIMTTLHLRPSEDIEEFVINDIVKVRRHGAVTEYRVSGVELSISEKRGAWLALTLLDRSDPLIP